MKIKHIVARQILDSRGNPTVEADVWLDNGVFGRAAVPSGASTGEHEAFELRDKGEKYGGLSVGRAVDNVNRQILEALRGIFADDQNLVDQKMIDLDGTPNKSRLGANAILAVSLAVAHAAAKARGVLLYSHINDIAGNPKAEIPMPMMNLLNGGKHAAHSSDFQEFMIIPKNAETFSQCIQIGSEIFQSLKKQLAALGMSTTVGDEGGFTYRIKNSNKEMLELLQSACQGAGYEPGRDIGFSLDVAASEFYHDEQYALAAEDRTLSESQMIDYLVELQSAHPILSIEDGLDQNAWLGWAEMGKRLGSCQLVGDDLLVTNPVRLQKGVELAAANAILIKPNQIGTLSETIKTIQLAKDNNWRTIVSHRSGETEDTTIVHLAIGTGAGQIKTGSLSRSERTSKYNELLRIELIDETLGLCRPF